MFCPNCGSKIPDGSRSCANCGANVGAPSPTWQNNDRPANNQSTLGCTPGLLWIIISISALLLIVAFSMALSADDKKSSLETEDLIVPIAATLISIGGSGYACFDANRKKQSDPKYRAIFIVALIVLILSGLMALEIVIGPLVGHFTKKR